ncbi:hypothetical protein [Iningainema tapete]|uniref:HEAT repeat domain-containing protein n=1 Tax=Iningainema tapete BLCC-T55 TaxID=2748662 RepID=A0A8J7C9U8_9CYAN|nr:hypothetical protein [Iningainema tapete]MBD2776386.1 hypothetical protein [Iningainema tapete BLCC-T55]
MSRFNLDSVIENLDTNQVEKQVPALEEATEIVNSLARKAVDALIRGPNRFLVAERLQLLGSVVVPHLEKLLQESDDLETKILAALVLLQFNSRVGVPCLLDAIANNEEYGGLVAEHLAKKGIKEAIAPIINRLSTCELKEVDLIVNLLDALEKLGGEIPLELRQRLAAPNIPWQIRTMIDDTHISVSLANISRDAKVEPALHPGFPTETTGVASPPR